MSQSLAPCWEYRHISHGRSGLGGMRPSSSSIVESVFIGMRNGLDMQEASGKHQATRRTFSYPKILCRSVSVLGIHRPAVDTNGGIIHSNARVQTSSVIAIGSEAASEITGGYRAHVVARHRRRNGSGWKRIWRIAYSAWRRYGFSGSEVYLPIKEQRRDRNVSNGHLCLATEIFQDTIVN